MERCKKGTRKYKPLGPGCHTHEDIEIYQNTKGRKKTAVIAAAEPIVSESPTAVPVVREQSIRAVESKNLLIEPKVSPKKKTRRIIKPPSPELPPPSPELPPPSPELPPLAAIGPSVLNAPSRAPLVPLKKPKVSLLGNKVPLKCVFFLGFLVLPLYIT